MDGSTLLLREIETFLAHSRMAPTTFGQKAVNDGKLVERLRNGGAVTLPTADKIRAFIHGWNATEPTFTPRPSKSPAPQAA